ncbi:molybdate ABC transporter substrate-binding protein [Corynebacterium liangguodongii]|uniref:Molybdate ABC transporter substrate-binding protein n=1 Tax=Corynebacterium liangguodongii TaxID=2079535 RepID=A0A2S0WDR3_9CORY|nr:molybdate ABC transporter substrate-binding protein [Corynebacterium liangguodongii]AWB83917.1 molybdate ABC transporter substrate-binding protein [Corynebacterium liangguodongii]PWB99056.1 molybdate ABC transporter substrate-binding protein [Corynebacterium liangguodongii]
MTATASRLAALALAGVVGLVFLIGCSAPAGRNEVSVFAAASLRPAGVDLARAFAQEHAGASVSWNYAGSSDLERHIAQGAPADVFISADEDTMERALAGEDFAGSQPRVIASNTLVLALAKDNPAGIRSLADLGGARVAVCAPEVPCGKIAAEVLARHGIELAHPTEEPDVAAAATKVATGGVDAAFIYSTDAAAQADKGVTTIGIGDVEPNAYPLALTRRGRDKEAAAHFADWMSGPTAQRILREHGFAQAL